MPAVKFVGRVDQRENVAHTQDDGVRPAIVLAPAVGLTLKGHGRDRTLKGLRGPHCFAR